MPDERPLSVTILINNYNYGRFLHKAIESALAQTWPFVEVLVVDDGSTDHSAEVAQRYAAPNYQFFQKKNGGQNSAIAHGLPYIVGDYTIILDSDDWLEPDAAEKVAKAAAASRPFAVMFGLTKVDPQGNVLGYFPNVPFVETHLRDHMKRYWLYVNAPTSGNAFETAFLKDAFRHVRMGTMNSDGYLTLATIWTEKVVFLKDNLGSYLIHGQNISQGGVHDTLPLRLKMNDFGLDQARHFYDWLKERGEAPESWLDVLDAPIWRDILLLKLRLNAYPEFSYEECRRYGVKRYMVFDLHGRYRQVKNIIFLFFGSYLGSLTALLSRRR